MDHHRSLVSSWTQWLLEPAIKMTITVSLQYVPVVIIRLTMVIGGFLQLDGRPDGEYPQFLPKNL